MGSRHEGRVERLTRESGLVGQNCEAAQATNLFESGLPLESSDALRELISVVLPKLSCGVAALIQRTGERLLNKILGNLVSDSTLFFSRSQRHRAFDPVLQIL